MKNNAVLSEGKLIAQARRGNHEAFTELVQKHSGKIYGVSLRMLKNREDAEDNVQNVLVKAYNNLGRFEGQSQFSTWLFRITINEALMKLRRHKPERFVNPVEASQDLGDVCELSGNRGSPAESRARVHQSRAGRQSAAMFESFAAAHVRAAKSGRLDESGIGARHGNYGGNSEIADIQGPHAIAPQTGIAHAAGSLAYGAYGA